MAYRPEADDVSACQQKQARRSEGLENRRGRAACKDSQLRGVGEGIWHPLVPVFAATVTVSSFFPGSTAKRP
jgi:hypothetical protein